MFTIQRICASFVLACLVCFVSAQTHITISNPETWSTNELSAYIGKTVVFDQPIYVTNNYYYSLTVSPRRIFSPTNQAYPLSIEYNSIFTLNNIGTMTLSDVPGGYHRMGEKIYNLTAKVNSQNSLTWVSGTFRDNTRADLEAGIPNVDIRDNESTHRLLVCTMNLEYYLVDNLGTGFGPNNNEQHQKQRKKTSKALAKIAADIYGLVEIEQGQDALQEIAKDLTTNTGFTYSYIDDGGSANGSYTKSGYVYRTDRVKPYGKLYHNNEQVSNRKKIQCFEEIETGERFFFSLNHFKAKSGTGTGIGKDADQGDGQGIFNYTRTQEAKSVIAQYNHLQPMYQEKDILIMGDLNAYAKEDPITTFTTVGMIDLHRAFHADSSYSYTFHGQAGYLDHALCNSTLFPQITGMAAYHINSDESDEYTYDKSDDLTMFRSSDHDPILVGLALDSTLQYNPDMNISREGDVLIINNAHPSSNKSFYRIYTLQGLLLEEDEILNSQYEINVPAAKGIYIIQVYYEGVVETLKVAI